MKKNSNSIKYFIILHITLFFYSIGTLFSKIASNQKFLSLQYFLSYCMVLVILFGYALVWQQLLKKMDLTVAYINKAIVIVWGIMWGVLFFGEQIRWNMILGAIIIIMGIWMVTGDSES